MNKQKIGIKDKVIVAILAMFFGSAGIHPANF